jgi:hypothetical protein
MEPMLVRTVVVYGVLAALLLAASLVVAGPAGLALRAFGAVLAAVAFITLVYHRVREHYRGRRR